MLRRFLKDLLKKIIPHKYLWPAKVFVEKNVARFLKMFGKDLDYFYGKRFAKDDLREKDWISSFCDLVIEKVNPQSAIDFGCGTADILYCFSKKGIKVKGVDGSKACKKLSKLEDKNFYIADLREPFEHKEGFDLCLCLEVAEHLEEKYSEVLVSNLTKASSNVMFTAAPPGQMGVNHVNLKPKKWWIEKFENLGFSFQDELTKEFTESMQSIEGIQSWYIDNLMVFKKRLN